jgi:hypothetical protein
MRLPRLQFRAAAQFHHEQNGREMKFWARALPLASLLPGGEK